MKRPITLTFAVLTALAGLAGALPVQAAETAPVQSKEGWYSNLVDESFVKQYAVLPKPDGVTIVDSRPTARMYDPGHIPTAISIPDLQFEAMAEQLPKDKSSLLVFYCAGVQCVLSHRSAFKAEKLGYSNVKVYPGGYPEWIEKGNLGAVSVAFLKKQMDEKAPMLIVDSRPKARMYDKGHIPGAISIPDSSFDAAKLPADKTTPLYFYCGGLPCKLSSNSAEKAVKLGYTNVKVVPEGYPAWEKAYGPGPAGDEPGGVAKAPAIEQGKEAGSITVASFERIFKEAPGTIALIDVRDPGEFASGTFKGAVNLPINSLEKQIDKLPTDKPIIFFCGAAGRGGEAHDMAKLLKPTLKTYFINAEIQWKKDGSYTMKELK
ncbi:MAG TPA: rhodanese-like domain-containing protein [Thiobacillaceae bacterium]|nr:rhodanese-like domain-containing protein [Thiobacillaceae bacterium]HNA81585.1 rhodanese-like domain-containing protein [Thiobacillaceae bacterium]HNF89603.1 rhodanese-like domain-containing protein [Thiobacillaceae bacterium]HNH89918.1 rhodanese-like domain-containing protein [Thiobacillaceae bacterium]HNL22837.1 rhodanese-like domain-containing protein [Rhodocyclaceae bacterium]